MRSSPHGFINSQISNFWTIIFTQQVMMPGLGMSFLFFGDVSFCKKTTRLVLIGPNLPENLEFEIRETMW